MVYPTDKDRKKPNKERQNMIPVRFQDLEQVLLHLRLGYLK